MCRLLVASPRHVLSARNRFVHIETYRHEGCKSTYIKTSLTFATSLQIVHPLWASLEIISEHERPLTGAKPFVNGFRLGG